jgi:hypothetical protein
MNSIISTVLKTLKTLGLLNDDNKVSITNLVVYVFLLITAFKTLFSGADLSYAHITWKVQPLDLSATMPMLFSLLNYAHKRQVASTAIQTTQEGTPNA